MKPAASRWLSALPQVDAQSIDRLSLYGLMLKSPDERVRLLFDDQVVEFAREDVTAVEALPPRDGLRDGAAIYVRLWLREGTKVLSAGGDHSVADTLFVQHQPFAVAVRDPALAVTPSGNYARLESEYLRRYSLNEPT